MHLIHNVVTINNTCVICSENFKLGESPLVTSCKHVFHQWCIEPWTIEKTKDKNLAIARVQAQLNVAIRNGRRVHIPQVDVSTKLPCPVCRQDISKNATLTKVQLKTPNTNSLTNKSSATPTDDVSKCIAGAMLLREFTDVRKLMKQGKFYLQPDLIITILQEDITHKNKNNVQEILSIIKCVSPRSAASLRNRLIRIRNTLLHDNNTEFAELFTNHLRA